MAEDGSSGRSLSAEADMPSPNASIRMTLVNNRNQKQRATIVVRSKDLSRNCLMQVARNKLRLPKACRVFLSIPGPNPRGENMVYEAYDSRHCSKSRIFGGSSNDEDGVRDMRTTEQDRDTTLLLSQLQAHQDTALVLLSCGEDYVGKEAVLCIEQSQKNAANVQPVVRVLAKRTPIEDAAFRQLHATSHLEGMVLCVGMPDLHAGNQFPVGAAFLADRVYPALIGGDIGCGMSLFAISGLRRHQLEGKENAIAEKLRGLEGPWKSDVHAVLHDAGIHSEIAHSFAASLGTIGRGNHFAELQVIDKIIDSASFNALGLEQSGAFLLVHSGSRGFGSAVLDCHVSKHGHTEGLIQGSPGHDEYMKLHNEALKWARCNRDVIAQRVFECLSLTQAKHQKVIDIWHNHVCQHGDTACDTNLFLHRKGAAPTDQGALIIPGSRGTLTYIARPIGDQEVNAFSTAHGAGREISRSKARVRFGTSRNSSRHSTSVSSLQQNQYGGVVVCDDKDLLFEEAPQAYKVVDEVVADLEEAGVLQIVATLKPMVTYKMRNE